MSARGVLEKSRTNRAVCESKSCPFVKNQINQLIRVRSGTFLRPIFWHVGCWESTHNAITVPPELQQLYNDLKASEKPIITKSGQNSESPQMILFTYLKDHEDAEHDMARLEFANDQAQMKDLQDRIKGRFDIDTESQKLYRADGTEISEFTPDDTLQAIGLQHKSKLIVKHSGLSKWKAFLANYDLALNRKDDVEAVDMALDHLRPLVKAKFLVTYPAYDETYRQFKAHFSHRMDQTFKYIEIAVRDYLSKVLNDNAECPTLQFKCEKKAPEESGIQGGLICNVLRGEVLLRTYYVKEHMGLQHLRKADLRELFLYKLFELIRVGPKVHFIPNAHYSGLALYIGTEQVPGFRRADAEGVEISEEMWAQRDFLRRVFFVKDLHSKNYGIDRDGKLSIVDFQINNNFDPTTVQKYLDGYKGWKGSKELRIRVAKDCINSWKFPDVFDEADAGIAKQKELLQNHSISYLASRSLVEYLIRIKNNNTVYECMQRKIVHRDIKNENIVIDLISGNTKRIDFGAATFTSSRRRRNFQGTRLYTAPEYFHSALYLDMEATVWSVGVVLYSALNGQLPFLTQKDVTTKHLLGPLPKFPVYSTEAEELIRSCLAYEPSDRISLKALRSHRWLSRLENSDWESLTKDLKIMENDLKSLSSSSFESGVGSSNEQSNAIVLDETSLRNEKTNENVDHQYNDTSSTKRTKHQDVKLSAIDCPETHERKSRRILPKMSQNSGISSPLASPLILKH
ncbi:hypothetical protein M3Y98_00601600 [Aphelenchoides besseyi]|nr:hypothetical protein M3Y98_00601600 [Aphelenchoides besseyi]